MQFGLLDGRLVAMYEVSNPADEAAYREASRARRRFMQVKAAASYYQSHKPEMREWKRARRRRELRLIFGGVE